MQSFNQSTPTTDGGWPTPETSVGERLKQLKSLHEQELITEEEFNLKRDELIGML